MKKQMQSARVEMRKGEAIANPLSADVSKWEAEGWTRTKLVEDEPVTLSIKDE